MVFYKFYSSNNSKKPIITRGGPTCKPKPTGKTFECRSEPSHQTFPFNSVLTCALDDSAECYYQGNYIEYHLGEDETQNFLYLVTVIGDQCKPKPKLCHCRTMLDRVLELNPEIDRIDGHFTSQPFMAGCRCYLGAAAEVGFNFYQTKQEGCESEFSSENYVDVCKKMQKKNCFGSARIIKT